MKKTGFALSLEAVSSLFLLLFAVSALQLYQFRQSNANDFFACSDAALALSKTRAFSGASLQEKVDGAGEFSGLCIEADSALASASSCAGEKETGEKFSFAFPVWQGGAVQDARVSCWRKNYSRAGK